LDDIFVASEVVDDDKMCKKEIIFFKVNFENAYNYLKWAYLEVVMTEMSFPIRWMLIR
jgi:hypothetical protein